MCTCLVLKTTFLDLPDSFRIDLPVKCCTTLQTKTRYTNSFLTLSVPKSKHKTLFEALQTVKCEHWQAICLFLKMLEIVCCSCTESYAPTLPTSLYSPQYFTVCFKVRTPTMFLSQVDVHSVCTFKRETAQFCKKRTEYSHVVIVERAAWQCLLGTGTTFF